MSSLTKSQRMAIEAKGPRILVSAGAGSGKTRVLVERICNLVQNLGVPAERILALTFTDQAAQEMKERIEQRLGHTEATILTFHRFCGRVVRENPLFADVDPAFALVDEAMARPILRKLVNRILYEEGSPDVINWVEQCGIDIACELVMSLYLQWRERPWDLKAIHKQTEAMMRTTRAKQWDEFYLVMNQLSSLHAGGTLTATGTVNRMRAILSAWELWPLTDRQQGNEEAVILQAQHVLQAVFAEVTRNVAKEAKPLFERLAVWKSNRLWHDLLWDQTHQIRDGFLKLLERIELSYQAVKEEAGLCDFSDLQRKAHHLLRNFSEVRNKYGKYFLHILVDEFQDTSPIQQEILELLEKGAAGETSLFMVGDVRQSIYRFRGADIKGFERIRDQLKEGDVYVSLRENFRSCPSLVAFVSDLNTSMFGEEGTVVGKEEQVEEDEPAIELLVPGVVGEELPQSETDPRQAEADLVARRILQMGPILWGDTAILLQTRTHLIKYQRALEKYGIPYVVYAGNSFWERQETQDLYQLLRLVDNPGDDLALLGFLRGPLVRLTDDGLWRLAKNGGLRKGFLAYTSHADQGVASEDRVRLANAKEFLARLQDRYEGMGVADWIYCILHEEGVAAALGGTGFDRILQMAEEMQKRGEIHLSDLLRWWESLIAENEKDGETQSNSYQGAVRIMTIHAAKGLEFPIVFVPDLTHRYTNGLGRLHLSDTWGLTAEYYDPTEKSWLPSLSYAKARKEERAALVADQKRLFYVAITRAQERLILSGAAAAFSDKESLEECSNWFDWLPILIPELREIPLVDRTIEGRMWKLRIRNAVAPAWQNRVGSELDSTVNAVPANTQSLSKKQLPQLIKRAPHSRLWSVTEWVEILAGSADSRGQQQGIQSSSRISPVSTSFPNFERGDLEAHELGDVLHSVLEHLRPNDDLQTIRTRHLIAALASVGITSPDLADYAWKRLEKDIAMYLNSDLHGECCGAQGVYSELPFGIQLFEKKLSDKVELGKLKIRRLNGERTNAKLTRTEAPVARLFLNGVIDKVWLRADGAATLVDFKTHGCRSAKEVQQVIDRYTPQVQLYAHVVEKLLGWNIDRAGLYLTTNGEFIGVSCDQTAREQLLKRMHRFWDTIERRVEIHEQSV